MNVAETIAMSRALEAAQSKRGATAPNPPVGAAAIAADGELLCVAAHARAGSPHAEALVLEEARKKGILTRVDTLVVTLEPCNHQGRTPPCSQAILAVPSIRRVIIGTPDPNPQVQGGGAKELREKGREVLFCQDLQLKLSCEDLIRPFSKWVRLGIPWILIKTAHQRDGSMIPAKGAKTFTSEASLILAHQLRRESDAILTGSGTVLQDDPEFTVRRVPDHSNKVRFLAIMDRRGRVPESYLNAARHRGLVPRCFTDLLEAWRFLGEQGCLQVLVEAGPTLSKNILASEYWDQHVEIHSGDPDQILIRDR